MSRPPLLRPGDVPKVRPASLSADDRRRFYELVDPKAADVFDLPNLIGCFREASRFVEVTPRDMVAEYQRTIKRLHREERTGRRDNEIRARLQNPFCLDHVSHPHLAPLAADPDTSASELRRAVESCLERTAAWPRRARFNPRWEAVKMAVIMASAWFRVAGRPELHTDKTAQREFVLTAMAAAGFPTLGLRGHPERLDRDEILGPWLAWTRADWNDLVKRNVAWHCLDCNVHFEAVYPPTCPVCKQARVRE
jgi:hypothetical protein